MGTSDFIKLFSLLLHMLKFSILKDFLKKKKKTEVERKRKTSFLTTLLARLNAKFLSSKFLVYIHQDIAPFFSISNLFSN